MIGTTTVQHSYVTQNGKVVRETIGSGTTAKVLDFIYDEAGRPFALKYTNGTATPVTYYYVVNLQGDVVKLITESGAEVASYTYNAWGEVLTATGTMAEINPLRYRGYYYDAETGFYYLQSRYYDPTMHRFINADSLASTGQGIVGTNMFAYCNNCPVIFADETGHMAGIKNWAIAMADGNTYNHYTRKENHVIITGSGTEKLDGDKYEYSYSIAVVHEIHTTDIEYVALDEVVTFRNHNEQIVVKSGTTALIYGEKIRIEDGKGVLYAYADHAGYKTRLKFEIEILNYIRKPVEYHYEVDSAKGLYSGISTAWDGLGSCGGINFMGSFGPCLQQPK